MLFLLALEGERQREDGRKIRSDCVLLLPKNCAMVINLLTCRICPFPLYYPDKSTSPFTLGDVRRIRQYHPAKGGVCPAADASDGTGFSRRRKSGAARRDTRQKRAADMLGSSRVIFRAASGLLFESVDQCRSSFRDGRSLLRGIKGVGTSALITFREFLLQPVWVPVRGNKVKEYGRGTLFVLDIARFGTTFACIFLLLFVSLNAGSFWQILASRLMPISITGDTDAALREKLKRVPGLSVAGAADGAEIGNLLSFLPEVRPAGEQNHHPKTESEHSARDAVLRGAPQRRLDAGGERHPGSPGTGRRPLSGHRAPRTSGQFLRDRPQLLLPMGVRQIQNSLRPPASARCRR